MTSPSDLAAIRFARWRELKAIGDPVAHSFLYADLESGKYDGRPCDSEPTEALQTEPVIADPPAELFVEISFPRLQKAASVRLVDEAGQIRDWSYASTLPWPFGDRKI